MRNVPWSELLDQTFMRNKELRRLARRICVLQDDLKERVNQETWSLYLELESLCAERLSKTIDVAARAAFKLGKQR